MARVKFTTAETTARRFLRQLFFRKIKDNDDDHEARILQVEGPLRMFDHFNHSNYSVFDQGASTAPRLTPQAFNYSLWQTAQMQFDTGSPGRDYPQITLNRFPALSGSDVPVDDPRPHFSVGRVYHSDSRSSTSSGALRYFNARSILVFQHSGVALPLIVEWRARWHRGLGSGSRNIFRLGMSEPGLELHMGRSFAPAPQGIWLERFSQADVRFVSRDSVGLFAGVTEFAKPLSDSWFGVKIEFDATEARCFFDDGDGFVLKETISQNLPTAVPLAAAASIDFTGNVGENEDVGGAGLNSVDYDLCDWKALGLLTVA